MSKYWHVLKIGIQNTLVYRVNFLFRTVFGFIPLFAMISLWRAIYEGQEGSLAGYSLSQMVSYYLVVTIVDALTAVNEDDWQIAADIRDGRISQFLLQPIDYLSYRLCLFAAGRLIYSVVSLIPVSIFIWFHRENFAMPEHAVTLGWFAVSLVLTGLLQFFISFTMALLAFWVLEVSTFIFILFAFEYAAGGHMFPLDLLPAAVQQVLAFTPFPYMLYFPVGVFLGKAEGVELYQGLVIQAGWVLAAFGMARLVWRRGLKHYSAVGG